MIKKINSIKNLGSFLNFSWQNSCELFKRYNFIYGWNYSGKTSLSRLFRCLELKEMHKDYPKLEFEIETDNDKITEFNFNNNVLLIRVFNEEFVEENFKWNDENHKISPILILGKDNIELTSRLKEKENEKMNKKEEISKITREIQTFQKQHEMLLTNKASDIRRILNITNSREFDRVILENSIKDLIDKLPLIILNENDLQNKLSIYGNSRNYEIIEEIKLDSNLNINELLKKVNLILSKNISTKQIIQKLKENPALNKWVKEGMELHKNEEQCQFCGNDLPQDLFERLNKHFSEEYNQLLNEIKSIQDAIENYKGNLTKIVLPDKARLYEEMQDNYEKVKNCFLKTLNEILNVFDLALKKLMEKKEKPFDTVENLQITDIENKLNSDLKKLNDLIISNKKKIIGLDEEKRKIKEKLLNHYTAIAFNELEYKKRKDEIENKKKEELKLKYEIKKIEEDISKIRSEIVNHNIAVEKINKYLKEFFSDDRLKLQTLADGTHQIYRNNTLAKNLSTGERNIISLIYFITKLEEINFSLKDCIIFIDDPVSSLDNNHVFKVYGFLSQKILECKQLFLTTHNFEFFNLIKDLVINDPKGLPNRKKKSDKENFYIIKKVVSNNERYSIIENLPEVLRKFRSEYNYLFSIIKQFYENQNKSNYDLMYILPNIVRRFLEGYLFQKYPDGSEFKEKCNKFFKSIELSEKRMILKLLDEYSHEENPEHSLRFPDIQEIEQCVKCVLDMIKNNDVEHYNALCDSLK